MAKYVIDISTLKGIGDAIRAKKGTSDPIPVPSLASEILSIEGDGGTYLGTTWRFRENTTADEVWEFVNEHGETWDGYFGGYIFETPFTTNPILESDDGEGTITEFTNVHLSYDGGEAYIQMTGNGGFVDIAYLDPDYGGSWRNDFTLTLIEEPSASDLAFLRAFCDQEPEYNDVIPLGNYVYRSNPDATLTCEIIEDEEGNPYPYWFETIDETDEVRQGFGIYITPDMTEIEASYEDYLNFYPCDNSPFKVFKEINVTEEQCNAFMQYFEFVGASAYNGVIPAGEYRAKYGGDYYNVPYSEVPTLDISSSGVWFGYAGENYSYLGVETMEDPEGVYIDLYADSLDTSIYQNETILIGSDVPVTEEEYNAFMYYFAPQ